MSRSVSLKYHLPLIWAVALLGALILGWLAVKYVSPSPPRSVLMSSGAADGAYHQFARRYQQLLKNEGIALDVRTSGGSVENLKRLNEGEVSVGFVQGGLGFLSLDPQQDADDSPLRSLAVIGYEPIWIFSHTLDLSAGLGGLAGKKVAVGPEGSGTRKVALELLAAYGLDVSPASRAGKAMLQPDTGDRKSTRLNSSHIQKSRMPSSA